MAPVEAPKTPERAKEGFHGLDFEHSCLKIRDIPLKTRTESVLISHPCYLFLDLQLLGAFHPTKQSN